MFELNHNSRRDARAKAIFFPVSIVVSSHGGLLPRAQRAGNVSTDDPHDPRLIRKGDRNPHQFLLLPAIKRNPQCLCGDSTYLTSSPRRDRRPAGNPESYKQKLLLAKLLLPSMLAIKLFRRAPQPCGKEVKRSSGGAGAGPRVSGVRGRRAPAKGFCL